MIINWIGLNFNGHGVKIIGRACLTSLSQKSLIGLTTPIVVTDFGDFGLCFDLKINDNKIFKFLAKNSMEKIDCIF